MSPNHKHQFIRVRLRRWQVSAMCRVLHVSEQGNYCFLRHRGLRDRQLLEQIYDCLREDEEKGENYEVRRIICWLRLHRNYTSGFRRIYRICREHHLTSIISASPTD